MVSKISQISFFLLNYEFKDKLKIDDFHHLFKNILNYLGEHTLNRVCQFMSLKDNNHQSQSK